MTDLKRLSTEERCERLAEGFAKALKVTNVEDVVPYVTEGVGTLQGHRPIELLRWDANSVHGYVFDTNNASAVRGASHVLKELDEELGKGWHMGIHPKQVLYSGGGGGLAVVPADDKAEIVEKLHRVFAERTLVATCTVDSVRLGERQESFGDTMARLHRKLSRTRALTGPDVNPPVPFFARRCAVCGERAAALSYSRGEARRERDECAVCHSRIEIGKVHLQSSADEVADFESFASSRGLLAVIYLDGNGIGNTIDKLKSPLDYKRFSSAIEDCMTRAFQDAAETYDLKKDAAQDERHRGFQEPIAGGDDRVIILPGDVALPLARDFLGQFAQKADEVPDLRDLGVGPLGAAAGIALGKAKLPVRHLIEEAEELLESAKRRVYSDGVRCALDFAFVDDGSPRRATSPAARFADSQPDLLPSGKPYELSEFETFSHRFRHVQTALATTQLYAFRRYAEAGPQQLRNHLLYQIGRHEDWQTLVQQLAEKETQPLSDPDAAFEALVPRYGGRQVCDAGDMIELLSAWDEGRKS